MPPREERHRVMLAARMRCDRGWVDVAIRNVSAHGMLLQAEQVPLPGSFLEIRLASLFYAVRTIWSDGCLFGVRTREAVDLRMMLADRASWDREPAGPRSERRRIGRPSATEGSHRIGSLLQFAILAIVAALAALAIERAVYSTLHAPTVAIEAALRKPAPP